MVQDKTQACHALQQAARTPGSQGTSQFSYAIYSGASLTLYFISCGFDARTIRGSTSNSHWIAVGRLPIKSLSVFCKPSACLRVDSPARWYKRAFWFFHNKRPAPVVESPAASDAYYDIVYDADGGMDFVRMALHDKSVLLGQWQLELCTKITEGLEVCAFISHQAAGVCLRTRPLELAVQRPLLLRSAPTVAWQLRMHGPLVHKDGGGGGWPNPPLSPHQTHSSPFKTHSSPPPPRSENGLDTRHTGRIRPR